MLVHERLSFAVNYLLALLTYFCVEFRHDVWCLKTRIMSLFRMMRLASQSDYSITRRSRGGSKPGKTKIEAP